MEAKIYNQAGQEVGKMAVPKQLTTARWNADLVHQVVTAMAANRRRNTAQAKGRSEVAGGGKKPWRQKGTGRARHGSIRSPLWRGGGVTHGPTAERTYDQKINKRMKARAFLSALAKKWQDSEVLLVDELTTTGKTREAATALTALAKVEGFDKLNYKSGRRALVALPERTPALTRGFRNLPSAVITPVSDLNTLDLLSYRYLVVVDPQNSLPALAARLEKK